MRFLTSFGMTMVLVLLLSCTEKQPESIVAEPEPLPFEIDKNLQAIDTLLQTDAVNALQELLSFDTQSAIFNENYHKLLLAESLFKTDNPQYYRIELQAAMHYFDSLAARYPGNDDIIVLSARSHYMNGVGFYENDSVVDACKEYLRTLEIMESHFDVDTHGHTSLRGYRAKFMGLTYNRLKELFTNQFMMEPAIYCGKKALFYCKIAPTSKYGVVQSLYKIGLYYDMLEEKDSAYYYYNNALANLPDSNNIVYRDITTNLAILSYYSFDGDANQSISVINDIANQTHDKLEKLSRLVGIGCIYYNEELYDSAVIYLEQVYYGTTDNLMRFQPAVYLHNIYANKGDTTQSSIYSTFMAEQATSKYEDIAEVSTLNNIFYDFVQNHKTNIPNSWKSTNIVLIIIAIIILTIVLISKYRNRNWSKITENEYLKLKEDNRKLKNNLNETECKHFNSLRKIAFSIYNKKQEDSLKQILNEFDDYYPTIIDKLRANYPNLSETERNLAILSFMGFRIKEEAKILNISENTVGKYRSKIRKKTGNNPVSTLI